MDLILSKIFATALAFSQVATSPATVKTEFDPIQDQQQVVSLLRGGCAQMRKAFDIEDLNVDDLIATAMDDPEAVAGTHVAFRGLNVKDLHTAYLQFCKNETVADSPIDIAAVIELYNRTLTNLPDAQRLKGLKLPGSSAILDIKGNRFTEVYEPDHRRVWVPLATIPKHVQQAFIAAEDKRFYQHQGIDERALIRAFLGNLAQSGRPQGGSTITQQVVKNLLVGDDVTYERKMREMILASRIEKALTKDEILELYLNSTFLGRGAWGVEMAARVYFGKSVDALTVTESALLAGITKGPNYYNPERYPDRARERYAYVLSRMQEDGEIGADVVASQSGTLPRLVTYERLRRDIGFQFVDQVAREAKSVAGIDALTADSYTVRSTIQPDLQRAAESALQEGLARFENDTGRARLQGAEANLAEAIQKIEADQKSQQSTKSAWQQALASARLPLYDVHWSTAIVLEKTAGKGGDAIKVGLSDGRILPLSSSRNANTGILKLHDVVYVKVTEPKAAAKTDGKSKAPRVAEKSARVELRVRPSVQGATVILENKTGRILAMTGSFSYPLSQLNRVTQAQRQPGSALKPLTYLAALQKGLQPNTYVRDQEITLPPINRGGDSWTPKNYEGGGSGVMTLRKALENSRNLATANLLDGGIDSKPALSLDRVCALALEAQIYKECVRYYPFVLGAQPVRPVDIAAFYAAIANEGARPTPHTVESIERDGKIVYRANYEPAEIASADHVSFYQLKSMMQGVLARGTAHSIAYLSSSVAGKTGTTDGENDVWFVGFTNEVTVAVWVGYDNADGTRRTLGSGQTGGSVAVPIFEPIIKAVFDNYAPRTDLNPPSEEAMRDLVASRDNSSGRGFVEYLRRDRNGRARDTRYALVARPEMDPPRTDPSQQLFQPWSQSGGGFFGMFQRRDDDQWRWQQQQRQRQQQQQQQQQRGPFQMWNRF
jgi:penicillin-binding protein 1A